MTEQLTVQAGNTPTVQEQKGAIGIALIVWLLGGGLGLALLVFLLLKIF